MSIHLFLLSVNINKYNELWTVVNHAFLQEKSKIMFKLDFIFPLPVEKWLLNTIKKQYWFYLWINYVTYWYIILLFYQKYWHRSDISQKSQVKKFLSPEFSTGVDKQIHFRCYFQLCNKKAYFLWSMHSSLLTYCL